MKIRISASPLTISSPLRSQRYAFFKAFATTIFNSFPTMTDWHWKIELSISYLVVEVHYFFPKNQSAMILREILNLEYPILVYY